MDDEGTQEVYGPLVWLSKSELGSLEPLELQEKRFVDEYLIDLNATQATIRAGYSPKAARQISGRLIAKASIKTAIAIAQDARAKRTEIDADRAPTEAWAIMTADARKLSQVKVDSCRHCHDEGCQRQRCDSFNLAG